MLDQDTLRELLEQYISASAFQREEARRLILDYDEDAVEPLADEFYSGVHEEMGIAIITLLGEIGGPDALYVLNDIYQRDLRASWQTQAAIWLRFNGWEDIL